MTAYRLISAEKARTPVSMSCRLLGVSRSGYYEWAANRPSERAVGRDQDHDPSPHEVIDLVAVPVAGVAQHDVGRRGDPGAGEFTLGGADHWADETEVGRADRDLCGQHDLLRVAHGLGVVALQVAARCLQIP